MARLEAFSGTISNGTIVDGVNWGQKIRDAISGDEGILGIVLSNSCDFDHDKIGYVVIAGLVDAQSILSKTKELASIMPNNGKPLNSKQKDKVKKYFEDFIYNVKATRYYTIYPAKELEDTFPVLAVDFQMIVSIPAVDIQTLEGVAELKSPYREEMMHRFTAYMGRVPVDRDTPEQIDAIVSQLSIGIL